MEEIVLDEAGKAVKILTNNLNRICPDLEYTFEQVRNDKKAQEYIKTWKKGTYSVTSLTTFINARCSYLYSKTTAGKRATNNKLDLLNYLYKKEPTFKEELYKAREKLDLGDSFGKSEFMCWVDAQDAIIEQYEYTNKVEVTNEYLRKITKAVMDVQNEFNLADEWYDVLLCQVASPEVQQRIAVRNMQLPQKISIDEAYGGTLTMRVFVSEIKNSDIKVISEVLKNIPNTPKKNGFVGIDDVIASDREKKLSWRKLSKKYGIPADNIRQKIYYNSKKN